MSHVLSVACLNRCPVSSIKLPSGSTVTASKLGRLDAVRGLGMGSGRLRSGRIRRLGEREREEGLAVRQELLFLPTPSMSSSSPRVPDLFNPVTIFPRHHNLAAVAAREFLSPSPARLP